MNTHKTSSPIIFKNTQKMTKKLIQKTNSKPSQISNRLMRFTKQTLKALITLSALLFNQAYATQNPQCDSGQTPISANAQATLITADLLFLEGPTWSHRQQAFYFSEMNFGSPQATGPAANIYKLQLPNTLSTFIKHSGSNGLLAQGNNLYALTHSTRSVTKINLTTKEKTVLIDRYQGQYFNSPNDIALHSNGTIYFTDPDWQLGERTKELDFTGVFSLTPQGKISLIDKTRAKPNGIVLSPDESKLYVGDHTNEVGVYSVSKGGQVGTRTPFISVASPDGITVDCAGNLYIASHNEGNIYVYSPHAKLLNKMYITPKITNMEFGGPNMKTLLITSGTGLYTLQTNLPGKSQNEKFM
ncbi:SMP-30/gluconolactonase/LRE family protein [Algibacillus agarilyticus]|uniref:SMP-30/gluconolactonase/LRE family protein n=1 Tax=Algibacillus agarilyticus TaxID=2234133 RepID=UPI001E4339EC|nr:SMP-30/gluconolactonase/LRE family protein [Algibacillus agarilyticus]